MTAHSNRTQDRRPGAETGSPATGHGELAAARFLRAFQVLLKSTRLYEPQHRQMQESLAAAERELRAAQAATKENSLVVQVESGRFVHAPTRRTLPDPRADLRPLADELDRRGIHTVVFLPEAHLGELANLAALLAGKPPNLGPSKKQNAAGPAPPQLGDGAFPGDWDELLGNYRVMGIRVNAAIEEHRTDSATTGLLALVLHEVAGPPKAGLPADRQAGAAESAADGEQLLAALRLLAQIGGVLNAASVRVPQQTVLDLRSIVGAADIAVARVVAACVTRHPAQAAEPLEAYVERLTEALVLAFAQAEFEARRTPARDLRALLGHIAFEVCAASLHPPRAGAAPAATVPLLGAHWAEEKWTEHLLERFWAELHASVKAEVLHGHDAWCVPVAALRKYVEPALGGNEASKREARAAIVDYARCLISDEAPARLAAATGLSELSDVVDRLWPEHLPEELVSGAVYAMVDERSPEVAGILSGVTVRLAHTAFARKQYGELDRILDALTGARPGAQQAHMAMLAERLLQEPRWSTLVAAALEHRHLDPSLVRILARDPERLFDNLAARLAQGELGELPGMARLVKAIGEPAFGTLAAWLFDPRTQRASTAAKLLAATQPDRLVQALPQALPSWDWNLQDLAVSELVSSGTKGIASVFQVTLPHAHPLVVPMMLDQIGLAREATAVPLLMEVAAGRQERMKDVFVRIKAIEALGRMGPAAGTDAAELLRNILRQRHGLTHLEPAGLRAAAEEALGLIENWPSSARVRTVYQAVEKSGLPHAQPRRYLRIPLDPPLLARIESPRILTARVHTISLGGALLESAGPLTIGEPLDVEIKAGLRNIHSKAVVRNTAPNGNGVEFVHMTQDDREKLRKLVAKLLKT